MDARFQAWLDQEDARMATTIRRHGWAIEYIGGECCSAPHCAGAEGGDDPPFGYTVGLFGLAHPELLIFDVAADDAVSILNELGDQVRSGEPLLPGQLAQTRAFDRRIIPEEVPNPGEVVFSANRYYQRPPEFSVPVLQLNYEDETGRFPWEDGFVGRQPRPGTFEA